MEHTTLIKEEDPTQKELSVNTCDWNGNESNMLQLTVSQHYDDAYLDLTIEETELLIITLTDCLDDMKQSQIK